MNGLRGQHRTELSPRIDTISFMSGDNQSVRFSTNSIIANGVVKSNGICSHGPAPGAPKLLVWSAFEKSAIKQLSSVYREYISQHGDDLDNLAHTLAARRSHLSWRSFVVADHKVKLAVDINPAEPVKAMSDRRVAFVFTGQGSQYLGMGQSLVAFPAFRRSLDLLDKCLKQLDCPWSLWDTFGSSDNNFPIDQPEYAQPLTTCLQIALVDLLKDFGIVPSVVLGHSSGEVAAAYAAGALSRFSAVKIVYHRGILSSRLAAQGNCLSMLAVGLSRKDVLPYLHRLASHEDDVQVSIGCVNSPKSITLTGKTGQLALVEQYLKEDSIFVRMLCVPIAYHSKFMEQIAYEYYTAIDGLDKGRHCEFVLMISSVTRDVATLDQLRDADYWVRNLTSTVEFEGALSRVLAQSNKNPRRQLGGNKPQNLGVTHLLEIGPHSTLQGPIRESLQAFANTNKPTYLPSLVRKQDASTVLLSAAGALYGAGYPVDILAANGLHGFEGSAPPDMPFYPFNHTQSYWLESRLSKNFRFREVPRHDLLGTRSHDWNPQMAQWRNIIHLHEVPWLQDHKINGEVIFPAAGMIVMAIEALGQLVDKPVHISGFHMRGVSFMHPIKFSRDTDKAEIQFNLSTPSFSSSEPSWNHFRLFVIDNDEYIECCNGSIRALVDGQESPVPFTGGRELKDWMMNVSDACDGSEEDAYNMHTGSGVQYGPCFQNIEHMRLGNDGEAVAEINTGSWMARGEGNFAQSYVVHPSILDGLAQLLVPALARKEKALPTMVPVKTANIWVSCDANHLHKGNIRAAAKCTLRGNRGASADIVAASMDYDRTLLYLEGLQTSFINSKRESNSSQPPERNLCTRMMWKPDIQMMKPEQIFFECTRNRPMEPANLVDNFKLLARAIMTYVVEAIMFVDQHPDMPLESHLSAYVGWMKYQQQRLIRGELPVTEVEVQQLLKDPISREQLVCQVEDSGIDGFFFMHVNRNLLNILVGKADPLDLMFRNGLADRYYEQMLANTHHAHPASVYLDLLCFKNPSMNILEVGAGTGGQTLSTLETMASGGVKKWARYDYTDISPSFFERARTKFAEYTDLMDFRVCDISKDPVGQSFEAGTYDLVIASHVIHATVDLYQSLSNIRKLLKPDGKLLLFETTVPDAIHVESAFGLLKDWWRPLEYEPRSKHSPCLTSTQWDKQLRRTGFTGVEVDIPGNETLQCRFSSIIVSSAARQTNEVHGSLSGIAVIVNEHVGEQLAIGRYLERVLPLCQAYTPSELSQINLSSSTVTVFLVEMDATYLDGISAKDYENLKSILIKYRNTLWVTRTTSGDIEPQHHLAEGLGRALASEDSTRKFATLCLDEFDRDLEKIIDLISTLVERLTKSSVEDLETNYVVSNGMLQISRISNNSDMNHTVARKILPHQQEEISLNSETLLSLHLHTSSGLQALSWRENELKMPELGVDEVQVDVRALGLTLRDHLIATEHLNGFDFGSDFAGVVQTAGAQTGFSPGDRVCLIGSFTAQNRVRAKAGAVVKVPSNIDFAEAASMPTAVWLSYHVLVDIARLQDGETVLVHHATSSVGQVMIHLAKQLGATVLVTSSRHSKRQFLCGQLNVPGTSVFASDDPFLANKVIQETNRQGVDVIVGQFATTEAIELSQCLAPFGRFVDIGLTSDQPPATSASSRGGNVALNILRASVNMAELLQKKPERAFKSYQKAMKMAFEMRLERPRPLHIFQAADIKETFEHFQEPEVIGKRVLEFHPQGTVNVGTIYFPPSVA